MKPEDVTLEVALKLLVAAARAWARIRQTASRSWPTTAALDRTSNAAKKRAACRPACRRSTSRCEQALELLAQPKALRRGFRREERAAQGLSAVARHQAAIQLLEGRYGLYLTDGVTNASLPKG